MRDSVQLHYYPFGMIEPERSFSPEKYRFGFNGKENDNEVVGCGNLQNYGMREYNSRLGRFISVDPLTKKYPWYSPYQFAGNKPIQFIDLDGLEEAKPEEEIKNDKGSLVGKTTQIDNARYQTKDPKSESNKIVPPSSLPREVTQKVTPPPKDNGILYPTPNEDNPALDPQYRSLAKTQLIQGIAAGAIVGV